MTANSPTDESPEGGDVPPSEDTQRIPAAGDDAVTGGTPPDGGERGGDDPGDVTGDGEPDGDEVDEAASPGSGPDETAPKLPLTSPVTPTRVGGLVGLLAGWWQLRPWIGADHLLVRDLVALGDPVLDLTDLAGGAGHQWDLLGVTLATAVGQFVGMPLVVVVVLLGSFVALGGGVARLAGTNGSRVAGAVAATAAVWNPWVWARLHQGSWLSVVALAALPWVVIHLRADHRWRLARSVLVAGIAGAAGWTVVVPTLVVVAIVTRRLKAAVPALVVLVMTAVPAVLAAGSFTVDPDGFAAMAANSDLPGGVIPSVITGGGHWNAAVTPGSRNSVLLGIVLVVLAVAGVYGAGRWRERPRLLHDWRTRNGFLVAALVGLVGTLAMASSAGQSVVAGLADAAPWLVALRNSTDLLGPWVLAVAVGLGHLAWRTVPIVRSWLDDVGAGERSMYAGMGIAVVGVAVVLLVMPDPLWGRQLPAPGNLPPSWQLAAEQVNQGPSATAVLVVPGDRQQEFEFAPVQVRVPLDRLVQGEVLLDQRWLVRRDGRVVAVDDDPASPEPVDAPTPSPQPTAGPTAAVTPEPSVVIDPSVIGDQPVPTTSGPDAATVRALATSWPDVTGRQLAEAGISWVAIVQPEAFTGDGEGTRLLVRAPEIRLLQVNPEQFQVAQIQRPQWPLLLDGVIATLAVALLLGAGPLRTGRELDPV